MAKYGENVYKVLIYRNVQKWMLKLMMYIQTSIPSDAVIQIWNYELIITVGVNEILSFFSTFPFFIFFYFSETSAS